MKKNELLKCDTETQREQMLLEKRYQKTLHAELPHILNFFFLRQYLWSKTKQSTIKWGRPVFSSFRESKAKL